MKRLDKAIKHLRLSEFYNIDKITVIRAVMSSRPTCELNNIIQIISMLKN